MLDPHDVPHPGRRAGGPGAARSAAASRLPEPATARHRDPTRSGRGTSPSCSGRPSGPTSTSTSSSTSSAATSSAGWSRRGRARRWPSDSSPRRAQAGDRTRPAHDPRRPRAVDDVQARGSTPGRPGRHQDPQPPARLQRQSLLRDPVQDAEVPARLPGRFGSFEEARGLLPAVLHLVQHGASPCWPRAADARDRPLRARPAVRASRQGVLTAAYAAHPERFVRHPPTPPALATAVWINPPPVAGGSAEVRQ